MYNKFEHFMMKYLKPIANKMDKQIHLSAVKKAMVALTPMLIIGSFCLVPEALPNLVNYFLGEENSFAISFANLINSNLDIIYLPYKVGMAYMSLYATVIISYNLAKSKDIDIPGAMSMAVISFFLLTVEYTADGGVNAGFFGPKGLFAAMFASIVAVELFGWCKRKNFTIKMPESVPDFVSRSFEMIPISIVIVGFFLTTRIICTDLFGVMPSLIFTNLLRPLVGSMDNPLAYTFVKMLQALLFFFGIHPSVLSPITSPISAQFLAENIAAVQAGGVATHFFTSGTDSAFGNFSGSGVTFGLVFWCLMSKNKALKQVGKVSLIPALFGINEPVLFGAPIVLNPIFFIPFVILGAITGSLGGWAISLGFMDAAIFQPPYIGMFLEGYMTNLDPRSFIVNGVQLILTLVVWYPFFKMYEKNYQSLQPDTVSAISKEDEALLDLDF